MSVVLKRWDGPKSIVCGTEQRYSLIMCRERGKYSIFGNSLLLDAFEEEIYQTAFNKQVKDKILAYLVKHEPKAEFSLNGIGTIFIIKMQNAGHAETILGLIQECFDSIRDKYSFTKMYIDWRRSPEWAKYWVASSLGKGLFSDMRPTLSVDNEKWIFPENAQVEDAYSMHFFGDWRTLIAEKRDDDFLKIVHLDRFIYTLGFDATHFEKSGFIQFI